MSFIRKIKSSKHFNVFSKKSSNSNNTSLNTNSNTNTINSEDLSNFKNDSNQRDLIIYHIDSETEGAYSLKVRVSLKFLNALNYF